MKKITLLVGLFFGICCCLRAEFQASFESFPHINDLPSNSVRRIFQDQEGYLWLGTLDGICRYDGYTVKTFRSDMNHPSLLTNNTIMSMAEDGDGQLWIGTRQGLNIYDKHSMQIRPFEEQSIVGDQINCLLCDNFDNIWIAGSRGLFRYDALNKSFNTYWPNPSDERSIPSNAVTNIYKDLNGTVWLMFWNGGLCRYIPESDNFERFPYVGSNNNPFRLYQDKNRMYWLCTWGDGLFKFDPTADAKNMYQHIEIENKVTGKDESIFFSIVQDDKYGYLWMMSLNDLYVMDYQPENQRMVPIDISNHLSSFSKVFSEIVKDKDNNLWIASFGDGPIYVNLDSPPIRNYYFEDLRSKLASSFSVISVSEGENDCLWMAVNRVGLCVFDTKKQKSYINEEVVDVEQIPYISTLNAILEVREKQEHWLSCNEDMLYILTPQANRYQVNTVSLKVGSDYDGFDKKIMFEDREGNIWVGMRQGLVKIDAQRKVQAVSAIPLVSGIAQDRNGRIWVSSEQSGLYRLQETDGHYDVQQYIPQSQDMNNLNLQCICMVEEGYEQEKIWIGTKNGQLLMFDYYQQCFDDISYIGSLTGEGILNILSDDYYNVWISTNKRIIHYNTRTTLLSDYSVSDHLAVNSFVAGSCHQNDLGVMYFGGNKGLCMFNASDYPRGKIRPIKICVSDVKIQNQSIFDVPDQSAYDYKNKCLYLSPDDGNLEVEFTTMNYAFAPKVQYAYKMEGLDKQWNYVNNRHYAGYNNLPHGKYVLSIMATDENGRWSDDIEKLEVVKRPAWYQSWWARVCYLCLLIAVMVVVYVYSYKRIRLNEELKIARIEKEKSEDLTQTKLRYFTNVSHELLTPLTVISCMIDDMENTSQKQSHLDVMKDNIARLKRLLQQILDFRKVENGAMKLKVMNMDLAYFVQQICRFNFDPLAKEKQIQFQQELPDYAMLGWFDSEKMDIILFNLLSNAFKYTLVGGTVRLRLSSEIRAGKPVAQLVVCDTGVGIAQDQLKNIFNRFYSNDPTHSVENHGIGLTLTKELVEMHHGIIKVDSEVGLGTTFSVEIPMDKESYSNEERYEPEAKSEVDSMINDGELFQNDSNEKLTKEDIHLLIVEDNAQLRTLVTNIFGRYYHVYSAENGKEAVAILNQQAIDIVVSDIIMPEMDGLELCRTIKNNIDTSHIDVLLLTAKNSINDRIECYNAGANGYLSKPFELKILEAKIKSLIKNRKNKAEKFKDNSELNISLLEYTSMDEIFLKNAVEVIEQHLSEPDFDLDVFSDQLHMSKSSLYRKLKSLSGLSPVEFTKNIRLKHACQMLIHQTGNISDVAYSVGFSDPKYFTSCFKTAFKQTPTEYIKQQREMVEDSSKEA